MLWKQGPPPPDTWHWGAVVLKGHEGGFFFADFHGDHVTLPGGPEGRFAPDQILWWTNCIRLPPCCQGAGAGRL